MSNLQQQALILMQALLGVISPNFRFVWIVVESSITVNIILEKNCSEDLEEIEDLKSEFEALQIENIDYEFEVSISEDDIDWCS